MSSDHAIQLLMLIAAFIPAIITIVASARNSGKTSQRLDDHDDRLEAHDTRLNKHGEHLQNVDIALVKIQEYQRGLTDGARLATGNHKAPGAH